MTTAARPTPALVTRTSTGIVAGPAGGLVFGAMMAMTGMLPMIAGLVGSTSAVLGAVRDRSGLGCFAGDSTA